MKPLDQSELRTIQLGLLDVFVDECRQSGLEFVLYYGSLLGAARHKGIIPWDDDIDIAMPRASYEKLKSVDWKKHSCRLIFPDATLGSPYLIAKICDNNTILIDQIDCALADIGANIDIFPLDVFGVRSVRSRLALSAIGFLKVAQNIKTVKLSKERNPARNAILAFAKVSLFWLDVSLVVRSADFLASRAGRSAKKGLGIVGSLLGPYGTRELMSSAWIMPVSELEFEQRMLPVPSNHSEVLTKLYGDYQTLPPLGKRVSHHSFAVYRK